MSLRYQHSYVGPIYRLILKRYRSDRIPFSKGCQSYVRYFYAIWLTRCRFSDDINKTEFPCFHDVDRPVPDKYQPILSTNPRKKPTISISFQYTQLDVGRYETIYIRWNFVEKMIQYCRKNIWLLHRYCLEISIPVQQPMSISYNSATRATSNIKCRREFGQDSVLYRNDIGAMELPC